MTVELSDTEKRAGMGIADRPNRQPLVTRVGPVEAAKAARARTLDVRRDARTPR